MSAQLAPPANDFAPLIDDRSYTVASDLSYLRGYPETVWKLRCYGSGACTVGEGNPSTYRDAFTAHRRGQVWVDTGVSVADQGAF
jgi:hypothetical protein